MKIFEQSEIGEVLQRIYNSELNFRMRSFFDSGTEWSIGDDLNGWVKFDRGIIADKKINWSDVSESISALAYCLFHVYPNSEFAQWYKQHIIV